MKRKFILLPITLTALAPAISLVGCGDPDKPEPEPVYQPYEIKWDGEHYKTDELTLLKDNYYKFWINSGHSLGGTIVFLLLGEREALIHVDAYVSCVLVGGEKVQYNLKVDKYMGELEFKLPIGTVDNSIEIYLRGMETKENIHGLLELY